MSGAALPAPGTPVAEVDTPALVIDLDAMQRNLASMSTYARERRMRLRPHAKMHKSATIAKLQIEAGAVGVCVQKLSEAEALAALGVADIFISYTASDRSWAFWVAKELESLAHTPHIHEWEIKSGDDIYAWMEQRHNAAGHVLCLVSDDYLKAPYSTLERNAAIWQTADKRPGFGLLAMVKPCKLPTLTDHIRRCELVGVPEDATRIRFREFMQKREAPATAAFPGKVLAVSNIPIRVPAHFMGRDDALTAIVEGLRRHEGRVAITTLHGLRGVGKTVLAAAYAERHRGDYRATWWIRAQSELGMRADLAALGQADPPVDCDRFHRRGGAWRNGQHGRRRLDPIPVIKFGQPSGRCGDNFAVLVVAE